MKKVGIITFHCADNFGAVLQAYSLQQVIMDYGLETEIIDFQPNRIMDSYNLSLNMVESIKQNGVKGTIKLSLLKIKGFRSNYVRIKNFSSFRSNYLRRSPKTYTLSSQLMNDKPRYDFYITGSDQVWNPGFFSRIGSSYFLDFAMEESIKISYAASIAVQVKDQYVKDFEHNLKRFDYISVREQSAKQFVSEFTDKEVYVTLDPTLLTTKDQWRNIATHHTTNEKYILVYDLVKEPVIVCLANRIAKEYNCRIVSYSTKKGYDNWHSSFGTSNPTEFLGLFEHAEFIVTSSFHGSAFAVLFNKPFYTVPHPTRGSRMVDLLTELGLNDRVIKHKEEPQTINGDVDYIGVNNKLSELRERSIAFLHHALRGSYYG